MSFPFVGKSTGSINVPPGSPISFLVSILIFTEDVILTNFNDPLPLLPSGSQYVITSQSPLGFFSLVSGSGGTQTIIAIPQPLASGSYTVTVTANTTGDDAGAVLPNTVNANFTVNGEPFSTSASATASVAICIHGSSLISLPNNEKIEISKLKPDQLILAANGKPTNIIDVVPCWTLNDKCGNCIIFEKDSLGTGIPSARFAVDAGHPICTPYSYNLYSGQIALTPAKFFVNNKNIYIVKWEDVASLLPGENKRYDIIMKEDSCKAYIANGIIVKARQERKIPGYSYV